LPSKPSSILVHIERALSHRASSICGVEYFKWHRKNPQPPDIVSWWLRVF
jgi:hypothetical protein